MQTTETTIPILFVLQATVISLTGVMAPGAITAATIAQGTRSRWAGALISVGHGLVEMPLILILMLGAYYIFKMPPVQIFIGLAGGGFLLWLGGGMLRQSTQPAETVHASVTSSGVATGAVLSATNPYFLLWWATVGLNLALDVKNLGVWALVIFAVIHWLCDLVWLSILSFGAFYTNKGAGLLGRHFQKGILIFCGIALLGFGIKFIVGAVRLGLN